MFYKFSSPTWTQMFVFLGGEIIENADNRRKKEKEKKKSLVQLVTHLLFYISRKRIQIIKTFFLKFPDFQLSRNCSENASDKVLCSHNDQGQSVSNVGVYFWKDFSNWKCKYTITSVFVKCEQSSSFIGQQDSLPCQHMVRK